MSLILSKKDSLTEKVKRKNNILKTIYNKYPEKVPIWVVLNTKKSIEKDLFYVIDHQQTFNQFRQSLKAKFKYQNIIQDKGYFYYVNSSKNKNKDAEVIITNVGQLMGQLYDRYKTQQGWLQISIAEQSIF